jgi:hypothetical protein
VLSFALLVHGEVLGRRHKHAQHAPSQAILLPEDSSVAAPSTPSTGEAKYLFTSFKVFMLLHLHDAYIHILKYL